MSYTTPTYTDLYQLAMAQVYWQEGRAEEEAVFDYFYRKIPFQGGYTLAVGMAELLEILANWRFQEEELHYLQEQGFPADFIHYLSALRFTGTLRSVREGEVVFPLEPVLQLQAPLIQAQLVETVLLNTLNFQSLIATKASRMRQVAGAARLADFGLRRAHALGGYHASRAALCGGFDATSNVRAGMDFHLPVAGTMAHSLVQAYEDELEAFRAFARRRPQDCVLLIDTYDTLRSGLPHAIKVAREMEARGQRLKGIRLDSGDLAYLARKCRQRLDEEGLDYVKIAASNQLDEYVIRSLQEQEAPIDLYGVGTSLVIGAPDAALDGVYKLAQVRDTPRIKLSESSSKTTLPGSKQVYRLVDAQGAWVGADIVACQEEDPRDFTEMIDPQDPQRRMSLQGLQAIPLLQVLMEEGKALHSDGGYKVVRDHAGERLQLLDREYRRFDNPHIYKVGLSLQLHELREKLVRSKQVK